MFVTSHSARVAAPFSFNDASGERAIIPRGPCHVEAIDKHSVAVFWGEWGERSAVLSVEAAKDAASRGNLVLLD